MANSSEHPSLSEVRAVAPSFLQDANEFVAGLLLPLTLGPWCAWVATVVDCVGRATQGETMTEAKGQGCRRRADRSATSMRARATRVEEDMKMKSVCGEHQHLQRVIAPRRARRAYWFWLSSLQLPCPLQSFGHADRHIRGRGRMSSAISTQRADAAFGLFHTPHGAMTGPLVV